MSLQFKETAHYVSVDKAYEHATMHVLRGIAQKAPGMEILYNARVSKRPLTIYDLNGSKLFFEFPIVHKSGMVGRVMTSASKVLGAPLFSLKFGPRKWNLKTALTKAVNVAKRVHRGSRILSTKLVCYSYPKMGILVKVQDRTRKLKRVIVDVADYHIETEKPPEEGLEGTGAYSYYESIPMNQRKTKIRNWEKSTVTMEAAMSEAAFDFKKTFTTARIDPIIRRIERSSNFFSLGSRVLRFCPHRGPSSHPMVKGLLLLPWMPFPHCFELHGQMTNYWCAVATGQMILDFWRYYFSQNDIATDMNTGLGGTTNPDQVSGYESLTNNQMDATYDTSANWSEAKTEIDNNRPVKSGVPTHARACAGWKRLGTGRWLYIYDPWPPDTSGNGGQIYWENWTAVNHTNFIYVRRV